MNHRLCPYTRNVVALTFMFRYGFTPLKDFEWDDEFFYLREGLSFPQEPPPQIMPTPFPVAKNLTFVKVCQAPDGSTVFSVLFNS